jgi:hypothetical protein
MTPLNILIVIVGVAFIESGYRKIQRAKVCQNWPSTEGKVSYIKSLQNKIWTRERGTIEFYQIDIRYSYEISDCKHVGHRISYSENEYEQDESEEKLAEYAVGTHIPVYYNPSDPVESVLEPGSEINPWQIVLGAMILIVVVSRVFVT